MHRNIHVTRSIFMGNIPDSATETQIQGLFTKYGTVRFVTMIRDRQTGEPRGFGFVQMQQVEADNAIEQLNGVVFLGQNLPVVKPLILSDSQH